MISVVIPTRNRAGLLIAALRSLARADFPRESFELIVADAGSNDATAKRVKELSGALPGVQIRHIRVTSSNANAARNAGVQAASGELVLLVDDDVLVPPGWMRAMEAGGRAWPAAGCLGGPVRPVFEAPQPRTCAKHALAGATLDEGPIAAPVDEVWGCNMAIRRANHEQIGPFDESLRVQQEWEWQQRLLAHGGQIVYLPDAWLWHRRLPSELELGSTMREFFRRGYTKASLGQHVPVMRSLAAAGSLIVHGLRARCRRGLSEGARELGRACGTLRARRVGWRQLRSS